MFSQPTAASFCVCTAEIVVMFSTLQHLKPQNCRAQLQMLGDFHPMKPCIIPDPYGVRMLI